MTLLITTLNPKDPFKGTLLITRLTTHEPLSACVRCLLSGAFSSRIRFGVLALLG